MKLSIMNELFTECWWWLLLWMFLAFLLGWLLRKWLGCNEDKKCCEELDKLKLDYAGLEIKYNQLKSAETKLESAPIAATKKPDKKDDLKVVEGIGPKIEQLFYDAGIYTWKDLSEAVVERLESILTEAGPRYRMAKPDTWAQQAKLADDGEWDKLKKLQDELIGGR